MVGFRLKFIFVTTALPHSAVFLAVFVDSVCDVLYDMNIIFLYHSPRSISMDTVCRLIILIMKIFIYFC